MSTPNKQNKKRRQVRRDNNVQKRLHQRFSISKERSRKKAPAIPSNTAPSTLIKNKPLRRAKTMSGTGTSSSPTSKHKFSASPKPKKVLSADSFSPHSEDEVLTRSRIFATKRHLRTKVPKKDESASLAHKSRSSSARHITTLESLDTAPPKSDAERKRPNSIVNIKKNKYFIKGTNSYTNRQKNPSSPPIPMMNASSLDPIDDFVPELDVHNSYQKPRRRNTATITNHPSGSGLLLNSMGDIYDIYEERETDRELTDIGTKIQHHSSRSTSDGLTNIQLSRPKSNPPAHAPKRRQNRSMDLSSSISAADHNESNLRLPTDKLKRHSSSVLDRVLSTIMNRSHEDVDADEDVDAEEDEHENNDLDVNEDEDADTPIPANHDHNSNDSADSGDTDLSTDAEMDEKDDNTVQCQVISARKYSDHVEYEIEVTHHNQQWVLYKRFKDFYDLNSKLKREYKQLQSEHTKLPTLPTRTRILNTMSSSIILQRKESFNKYLQNMLKIRDLVSCPLVLHFLNVRGGNDKYSINIWKMGDSQLAFDCHHVLQLRFSARNIPIQEDEYHGCLLKISQREVHSSYYSSMRPIMITDFVIDNRHPRFCKTLLYNYHPTKDNQIKIELMLSDAPHALSVGSASINITYLLAKHKGYLYVPIITDLRSIKFKHRRSLPDLNAINKKHLRADENPEFTRTPCFIIAATAVATGSANDDSSGEVGDTKIAKLTGNPLHTRSSDELYSFQVLPKPALPRNLRIIPWSDAIENKLKGILSNSIETAEFRQSVRTNKQTLTESNYFSTKTDEKSVREHIASVLLNCWKKCLDAYLKSKNKSSRKKPSSKSRLKGTLLLIMCKLANRFEFDLSHIQHWQHEHVNGFKALTTFQWERIMKQYYKLFIRTLEIALSIVDSIEDDEEEIFCKEMIGLSAIRMSHMHHKLLPLVVHEMNTIVRTSKAKRYEFLVQNYPDEETEKGFMKHSWQEEYVAAIANRNNNIQMAIDPFYSVQNPAINPSAWRWFAPPDTDKNAKIQIHTTQQKQFIRNNWQFIIKFIVQSLANYCRDTMYWSKVEGFPRLEQLLIQSIIWTPLNDKACVDILQFISALMKVSEMRHCIGNFGKALIRNTDAMHPTQVENCFKFLREWITNSGCVELGLLPHSFCYDDLYSAAQFILSQQDWQLICVFLSFILHHSHLFKESFRSKVFSELLIKEYFGKLCCHWNRLVRKYYFMVLLYCMNRSGYFHEERRKKCVDMMDADIINTAHRCYVLFDNMTHLITTRKAKGKTQNKSKQNVLLLTDIATGDIKQWTSSAQQDEDEEINHLHSVLCDMKLVQKIENDCHLIELLNLEITQMKNKRKEIQQKYRPYIDSAFTQFANLCVRYKKIQLTKKNSWVLGEVVMPTIMYHVRDRDKHLNKFQKSDQDSHKFVQ